MYVRTIVLLFLTLCFTFIEIPTFGVADVQFNVGLFTVPVCYIEILTFVVAFVQFNVGLSTVPVCYFEILTFGVAVDQFNVGLSTVPLCYLSKHKNKDLVSLSVSYKLRMLD